MVKVSDLPSSSWTFQFHVTTQDVTPVGTLLRTDHRSSYVLHRNPSLFYIVMFTRSHPVAVAPLTLDDTSWKCFFLLGHVNSWKQLFTCCTVSWTVSACGIKCSWHSTVFVLYQYIVINCWKFCVLYMLNYEDILSKRWMLLALCGDIQALLSTEHVLHVLLAVNMCINYSFLHLYL